MAVSADASSNMIAAALENARRDFQDGNFDNAKAACSTVLDAEPTNAEAWYYLGRVAFNQGEFAASLDYLHNAAKYDPAWAEASNHCGNALRQLGRLDEALERYHQAMSLKSSYAEPVCNIGFVLMAQAKSAEAENCFREALEIDSNLVAAWNGLALLQHSLGNSSAAVDIFKEALRRTPENLATLNNLGAVLLSLKQAGEAAAVFRRAVAVAPDNAQMHNSLGVALREAGQTEEAIPCYRQAITLNPDNPDAYNNLGVALYDTGKLSEAEANCRRALTLRPAYPEALNNLSLVLMATDRLPEAEACCRKSIELLPANAEARHNLEIILKGSKRCAEEKATFETAVSPQPECAVPWYNLGHVRNELGDLEGSIDCYRQALKYRPDYTDALNNLGASFTKQGRIEEALIAYRQAAASDPRCSKTHSRLLFTMQYSPRYTAGDIFAESRRWEDLHGNNVTSDLLNAVDPLRPLRIGYVSSDFRRHSVSYFLRALFANHSRTEFRIYCYSDVSEPDEYTSYFRTASDGWRDISGLGDNEVARMVSEDAIDILVDLAAHTGDRLTLFTRRLAPVQVTWLGYPGTSGLSTIDYRISDDIADPPGESDRFNSERVYRLPDGFLCYTPPVDTPGIAPLPSAASAQITFGSFNSIAKITPEVVGLWSKVLHNNPESRLIIKTFSLSDGATRKRYTELFTANGIDIERVELRPWERNTTSHLAVYGEVDIALDTFPYNGTTTTCESLWMGVPVVTLSGERHSARVGTSILSRVGLDDLVAATPDEYLRITENLARDKERLIQLRQTLRKKMQASPLSDGAAFTGHMEKAFRRMWGDWCLQKSQ